jgi:hypothetical protein
MFSGRCSEPSVRLTSHNRAPLTPFSLSFLSLHFHSVNGRMLCEALEVAHILTPVFTAVDVDVFYFQSTVIFPSWTSPASAL